MPSKRQSLAELVATLPRIRLVAAILGLLLLVACYFCTSVDDARSVVRYSGYWFTFFVSVGFITYLYRVVRTTAPRLRALKRSVFIAILLSWGVGAFLLFAHATFGPKVMMDDAVLESTARNLHESRQVYVTTYGRSIENQFTPFDGYLDKRPWFSPFVISVMHDFTGYRVSNPYIVNAIIGVLFLGLMHLLGWQIAGFKAAVLLPLLWLTIPLFAQNATGSGMDILNLFMLAVTLLAAIRYLQKPSYESEGMLCLSGVLLAYTRYESVLFCGFVLLIVCIGWVRSGRVFLSAGTILSAPLLIGLALQQKFFAETEALWELNEGAVKPFGFENVAENTPRALNFFFHMGDEMGNSLLVGVLGLIAMIFLLVRLPKLLRNESAMSCVAVPLGLMAVFLCGHLLVILCYHDGALDRLFASRFALPFYLLLTYSLVLCLNLFSSVQLIWRAVYALTLIYLIGFALPNNAKGVFNHRNYVVRELQWIETVIDSKVPSRALLVDSYGVYWALRDIPALSQAVVLMSAARIVEEVEGGKFSEIIIIDRRESHIIDGAIVLDPSEFESVHFELELIEQASFKPFQITQVYSVTNVRPLFRGDD